MTTAERLLAWARAVAAHPELGLQGTWPRAAALLGRQALEEGLDGFWMRQLPQMREATRATQLACFERFVRDRDLVLGLRTAWAALQSSLPSPPVRTRANSP